MAIAIAENIFSEYIIKKNLYVYICMDTRCEMNNRSNLYRYSDKTKLLENCKILKILSELPFHNILM